MENIKLIWMGPFSLATADNRSKFIPPHKPGVYLWTIAQHLDRQISFKISYVGQTSSLRDRMYQHISGILGGQSSLYGEEHLIQGEPPEERHRRYTPGHKELLNEFLNDFKKYSQLAYQNLVSYSFFWAEMPEYGGRDGLSFRNAVESALIKHVRYKLQNDRPSLKPNNCPKVMIESEFLEAEGLRAVLPPTMSYGEIDQS